MTGLQVYLDRVKNSKGKKLEKGKNREADSQNALNTHQTKYTNGI